MEIDLQLNAAHVIPVIPENQVLSNTSIIIKAGRILDILPVNEANAKYTARKTHELDHHILMPGLVNAHTHAAMNLFRGYADDMPLMNWLQDHIWPAEQKWVTSDFVHDGALLACAEMLRGGTTCFADMYFFPESTARAAEQSGIRATIGLISIDFPSAYAQNAQDYLQKGLQVHDQLRGNPLIKTMFAPHGPYTVSDEPLQQIATLAEELDLPIHIHLHETNDEIEQSLKQYKLRPLERLQKLGLLTPRLMAVHMTHLEPDEIPLCAEAGVNIIHCPESNLKLASGFCPTSSLAEAGLNIAIGTDSAASNNDLDMFGELRTAALLTKGSAQNASSGQAAEILKMATINGAKALGLDDHIGSIEVDKSADLIAIEIDNIESLPLYNPISHAVYSANRQQVSDVWVAGKQIINEHSLLTLDINELSQTARHWQKKISS